MKNQYPGTCDECGGYVYPHDGVACPHRLTKTKVVWHIYHEQCKPAPKRAKKADQLDLFTQ